MPEDEDGKHLEDTTRLALALDSLGNGISDPFALGVHGQCNRGTLVDGGSMIFILHSAFFFDRGVQHSVSPINSSNFNQYSINQSDEHLIC